jgi:hypothetical protein
MVYAPDGEHIEIKNPAPAGASSFAYFLLVPVRVERIS